MNRKTLIYSFVTAVLLGFSFPRLSISMFAWVGFIPFFLGISTEIKRKAFWYGYITGFIFFILTIYWLLHVTLTGMILLCLYLSLYFASFGYFFAGFRKIFIRFNIWATIFLSSVWVMLEYLRSNIFSGFPWAILGYSQYLKINIIQLVDIFGASGLSFIIIFVNISFFEMIVWLGQKDYKRALRVFTYILIIFLAVYSYGSYSVKKYSLISKDALDVSLIQGNISQNEKWQSTLRAKIKDVYFDLSKLAMKDNSDLIIWPETSYPDYLIDSDGNIEKEMNSIVKDMNQPLLFGAVYQKQGKYFNSAILFSKDRNEMSLYNKIHLVPFGEYIPLRRYCTFLERFIPIEDFTPGKESTIFKVDNKDHNTVSFGVLICFEDTMQELSRKLRLKGADFLVNITNDAWFKNTSSPFQHLQASVFRAVENRVPLVRAANTGVSCLIDNFGRIVNIVDVDGKSTFVKGFVTGKIMTQDSLSLYTRFGAIFVLLCGIYVLIFGIFAIVKMKQLNIF